VLPPAVVQVKRLMKATQEQTNDTGAI